MESDFKLVELLENFNLVGFLKNYREFSQNTFGPGTRTKAVMAHIDKELNEILDKPDDPMEWADLLLLAFDGALRRGFTPEQITMGLIEKSIINQTRQWPDWRTVPDGQAIEHVRSDDEY